MITVETVLDLVKCINGAIYTTKLALTDMGQQQRQNI